MKKNIASILLSNFLLIIFFSHKVFGWGAVGHRTVGHLAAAKLSPQAQAAVQRLLGQDNLADVANWADSLKSGSTYGQTVWYHFEKIPDDLGFIDNLKALPEWQQQKGGVVGAILVASDILRSGKKSVSEQTDALKFLVHFVGDIHQPLHTGRPEDNGGVKINTTWFGKSTSLHAIWDSGMIATGHKDLLPEDISPEDASFKYAKFLAGLPTPAEPISSGVETWLNESMGLRFEAYNRLYESNPDRYQKIHLPEIDQRILLAGLRLGQLLNEIFADEPVLTPNESLWRQIEAIVGNIHQVIRLTP